MYQFNHEPVKTFGSGIMVFENENHVKLWLNFYNLERDQVVIVPAPTGCMDDPVLHCSRLLVRLE